MSGTNTLWRPLLALALISGLLAALLVACDPGRTAAGGPATPSLVAAAPPTMAPPPTTAAAPPTVAAALPAAAAAPAQGATRIALPTVAAGPSQAPAAGWNQLGGNPQRTHYVAASLPPTAPANTTWRVLWIWNGPAGPDAGVAGDHLYLPEAMAPVAGEGRLYVGHSDGAVRAIRANDGALAWTRQLGGEIVNSGAYDPLTRAVYFGAAVRGEGPARGRLYKLRPSDGAVLGQLDLDGPVNQAVLLAGDTVYVGTMAGTLYAVNPATMAARWTYAAGAPLLASAAYASKGGGLVIFPSEDGYVHAVRAANGVQAWRVQVNVSQRPERDRRPQGGDYRPAAYFPDTYAVVAEAADAVIIRSYYDWQLTWAPNGGAPASQSEIRAYIEANPRNESFFVLDLDDGRKRFIAPVLGGAIGNGNYYYSSPPQAVVKRLPDGSDVAYLFWRNRAACRLSPSSCDGREDTTIGEMDLQTGAIRFVQDHKNQGTMRVPTDEQGQLAMVGDVLFHSHWMSLGALRIPDRSVGGESFANPIPSEEYMSISNTVAARTCPGRITAQRYCPVGHTSPTDPYQLDPGFYIYFGDESVYDNQFKAPVRTVIYDSGVLYWRSNDGAIIALAPTGVNPPTPAGEPAPAPSVVPSSSPVEGFGVRLPYLQR